MSTRPYLNPAQPVEVVKNPPPTTQIAIGFGLVILLAGVKLWRLMNWRSGWDAADKS